MKPIEDRIADKIFEWVNYLLSKIIKADISVDKVRSLTQEDIAVLKEKGIRGIVLDVDETLRKDMKSIPKCNQEWIDKLKQEFKVIVVSNGFDTDIEKFFQAKGIDYIGFANKPLKKNLLKACRMMKLNSNEVAMIGNDSFSDIYGGKRIDMTTIKVKDVEEEFEY